MSNGNTAGAEVAVQQVSSAMGGLVVDEQLLVYGGLAGYYATLTGNETTAPSLQPIVDVLVALRTRPCRWCGGGARGHALDVSAFGVEVRCLADDRSRPVPQWSDGPSQISPLYLVASALAWVGLPLLSMGLLSWLMPLLAAVRRSRTSWGVAAALLFGLVVVSLAVPSSAGVYLLMSAWCFGAVYGGLQVRPWVAGRRERLSGRAPIHR